MELPSTERAKHSSDVWNIYPENAVLSATPKRKRKEANWCVLLMYEFACPVKSAAFYVNPLDLSWDLPTVKQEDRGQTFYTSHLPLPVTLAFIRIDKLPGSQEDRVTFARKSLLADIAEKVPRYDWAPPKRKIQNTFIGKIPRLVFCRGGNCAP